jgi:hypothetical protein
MIGVLVTTNEQKKRRETAIKSAARNSTHSAPKGEPVNKHVFSILEPPTPQFPKG